MGGTTNVVLGSTAFVYNAAKGTIASAEYKGVQWGATDGEKVKVSYSAGSTTASLAAGGDSIDFSASTGASYGYSFQPIFQSQGPCHHP